MHILVIEDEASNLFVFLAQLRKSGTELVCQGTLVLEQARLATTWAVHCAFNSIG